jgi:hypothetical protein
MRCGRSKKEMWEKGEKKINVQNIKRNYELWREIKKTLLNGKF